MDRVTDQMPALEVPLDNLGLRANTVVQARIVDQFDPGIPDWADQRQRRHNVCARIFSYHRSRRTVALGEYLPATGAASAVRRLPEEVLADGAEMGD
jgi:hypothetical protein